MPDTTRWRVGLIGTGRLGSALAVALARRGEPVLVVFDRESERAGALARRIPGCSVAASAQDVVDSCDLVFLTVPDDLIEATCSALRWRPGTAAVHCSGAHGLDVLEPARRAGAWIGGFHPVQTFAGTEADAERLAGCVFGIEAGEPLRAYLEELAYRLGGYPLAVEGSNRVLYHAAAVFASNAVVTLAAVAARIWQELRLPAEQATRGLAPLMRTTVENIERLGTAQALTGPVARGDVETVRRHVSALAGRFPELLGLYREITRQTVALAEQRGLDRVTAQAILEAVETAQES
uniref:DUF2520 domain-containing protein n=1 Tax=Thermorudis peleae TaxID=1382356 RepID=A0A831X8D8_9BACT